MPKYTNKLIDETSPYLLQHANNPVNWYPWDKEALEKSKKEGKPIFLSIGYSTCHWCHVMEKESFEDEQTADYLNKNFVSIKVDREERPDLDAAYMQFSIRSTGSGGWPLNVFLTPDQKPFFSGTYFPKQDQYNTPSFISILEYVKKEFENEKGKTFEKYQNQETLQTMSDLNDQPIKNFNRVFEQYYDSNYGGMVFTPKFPITLSLLFNLEQGKNMDKTSHTLKCMGNGGIYDHLEGGFSRYSTDQYWLVPHFEKTLYDNALLLEAYSKTYRVTEDVYFKEKAKGIYNYLKNNLLSENGFYSGQDADSEGKEGKFYAFTLEEIKSKLPNPELFIKHFNIRKEGNFEGSNILYVTNENLSKEEKEKIECDKNLLLRYRNTRIKPDIDTKIITSWNALAISALVKYWEVFQDKQSMEVAQEITDKILKNCFVGKKLIRIFGKQNLPGFLEDYSFFQNALLDVYETTKKEEYLKQAKVLTKTILDLFYNGKWRFSFTSNLHEKLYTEIPSTEDSVIPSSTSMVLLGLFKLIKRNKVKEYESIIEETLKLNMKDMQTNPLNHQTMIRVLFHKLKA